MKTLVISDTHGYIESAVRAIESVKGLTGVIHLGDMVSDAEQLQHLYPRMDFKMIRGNNDFAAFQGVSEALFELYGMKIFAAHGHMYRVKSSPDKLAAKARALGAEIALFGHTHILYDKFVNGVRMLNPSANGYIVIEKNIIEVKRF